MSAVTKTLPVEDGQGECALDIPGNVCSTDAAVTHMKDHLIKRGLDQSMLLDKEAVVKEIKNITKCTTEECVLNDQSVSIPSSEKKASLDNIKPAGPSGSTKLLNNNNIDGVLRRLTKQHKGFHHMDFQMIDFAGIKGNNGEWVREGNVIFDPTPLGLLNMSTLVKSGKKTFGVVMNTDKRNGGGIHWFALFCDFRLTPCTVEYFNSSGNRPYPQIQEWLKKTVTELKDADIDAVEVVLSGLQHQIDSETECGPYSLYYIWNRLNNIPSHNFQKKRITDADMIIFRKKLFK
jgi:hypothetical protein